MSLLCFFAHHRCASSWTNDMLRTLSRAAGLRHRVVHDAAALDAALGAPVDMLTFSNARWDYLSRLPPFIGFHLVRDPRDVLVSSYFSHRFSHPTDQWPALVEHRRELQSLSMHDGLLLELECRAQQFEDMLCWRYDTPSILEKRMEDMIRDPLGQMTALLNFWGKLDPEEHRSMPWLKYGYNRTAAWMERKVGQSVSLPRWRPGQITPALLRKTVQANDYYKKSGGRLNGQPDPHHHYRAGAPGDWREYFFPELRRQFKGSYNELLVRLGYEQNADW